MTGAKRHDAVVPMVEELCTGTDGVYRTGFNSGTAQALPMTDGERAAVKAVKPMP